MSCCCGVIVSMSRSPALTSSRTNDDDDVVTLIVNQQSLFYVCKLSSFHCCYHCCFYCHCCFCCQHICYESIFVTRLNIYNCDHHTHVLLYASRTLWNMCATCSIATDLFLAFACSYKNSFNLLLLLFFNWEGRLCKCKGDLLVLASGICCCTHLHMYVFVLVCLYECFVLCWILKACLHTSFT